MPPPVAHPLTKFRHQAIPCGAWVRFRIAVHCHEDIAYAISGEGYESRVSPLDFQIHRYETRRDAEVGCENGESTDKESAFCVAAMRLCRNRSHVFLNLDLDFNSRQQD